MVEFVISTKSQEEALSLRDKLCKSLVGIPGFINNEIIVCSQSVNEKGEPLCEDGNLVIGDKNHCVCVTLASKNQRIDTPQIAITLSADEASVFFTENNTFASA